MTARKLTGPALTALALAALCAGCGSTAAASQPRRSATAPALAMSLADAEATSQAAWAVLPMGSTSGPNQFWQLFLDAGRGWRLDTPPDIATNGAVELAGLSGASLTTGVRPSLYLTYSPVSSTADGKNWTAGPPAAGLADVPDALAATAGGRLLALSTKGDVSSAGVTAPSWRPLISARELGAGAGRSCKLIAITAVAYSPAGDPVAGASCRSDGVAGVFEQTSIGWRAAGPALPAALAGDETRVLRLVTTSAGMTALIQAGTGPSASLLAAWRPPGGAWTVSAPLTLGTAVVRTSSFGAAGSAAVVLSGQRAETISGPGATWHGTPTLPAGRNLVIALPAGEPVTALAAGAGTVTIWRLTGGGQWALSQKINVPIQYGSSG